MTLVARAFQIADRAADALGIGAQPTRLESLLAAAERRSGVAGSTPDHIEAPLRALLHAYETEADLSLFGRMAVRWDMVRFLANLMRLHEEERRDPALLSQPIEAPLLITGLPRSGTTFLHGLLAEDPGNLVPRCWQTIFPYPLPGERPGSDARARRVDRQLRGFTRIAPEFRGVHPLDSRTPQECTEITAHSFMSLRFDTTHHIPSYRRWLDATGHESAYRMHRRFLQHLQAQAIGATAPGSRRWVLKSPDHVFAFDALSIVYPDARLVFVHRDPLKVLPSVAKLTEILRAPFTRRIDRRQIGQQVGDHWARGVAAMMDADRRELFPHGRVLHLHYRELVAAPVETVARLYRHFGMEFTPEARGRIADAVRSRPQGGYEHQAYRFEEHGLDVACERERFAAYTAHFAVETEMDAPRPSPPRGGRGVAAAPLPIAPPA
ncbi:MAG TPA: sulfotransferase [Acetobacteraceae bacterium]|nr:sulfotransferase [Acetobacteraceae bacterium]